MCLCLSPDWFYPEPGQQGDEVSCSSPSSSLTNIFDDEDFAALSTPASVGQPEADVAPSALGAATAAAAATAQPEAERVADVAVPALGAAGHVGGGEEEEEEDADAAASGSLRPPGHICHHCGMARHLNNGHAFFKGHFFCPSLAGGQPGEQWLEEQEKAAGWPPKQEKEKKRYTCRKCGLPARKEYGHSRWRGELHCSLQSGQLPSVWLRLKRQSH